jgi:hypothetical protein
VLEVEGANFVAGLGVNTAVSWCWQLAFAQDGDWSEGNTAKDRDTEVGGAVFELNAAVALDAATCAVGIARSRRNCWSLHSCWVWHDTGHRD